MMAAILTYFKKKLPFRSLFFWIIGAGIMGSLLGVLSPSWAMMMKPLSDAFLRLISMIVAPLVFCVVVQGITGVGNLRTVGRVGLKALLYFEVMTSIALLIGVAVALFFGPGQGMHINISALDGAALQAYDHNASGLRQGGVSVFLLHIIPASPVAAFAANDVLQILFFAILFGVALSACGTASQPVGLFIEALMEVFFRIMRLIVKLAPFGVFGGVSFTVGHYGLHALGQLGILVIVYFVTVLLFVLLVLGGLLRFYGLRIGRLLAYFKEELMIVFATTSSDAVLPQVMEKLIALGIKRDVVGLVIPAGYSFNLDAFSIYLSLAVLFLAQATGINLSWQQITLVLVTALVTSKGAHGVPGVAIVILAATLAVVPSIPPVCLVLLIAVDWFMGIARASGNVVGNCVATIIVAVWEKDIDLTQARIVLGIEKAVGE